MRPYESSETLSRKIVYCDSGGRKWEPRSVKWFNDDPLRRNGDVYFYSEGQNNTIIWTLKFNSNISSNTHKTVDSEHFLGNLSVL